jgi:hypothetical protein
MARRFVPERAVFARFHFPFRSDETGQSVGPCVQFGKDVLMARQIFGLIVAVWFVFPKLDVLPELIRNFHAAIPALPDKRSIAVAFIFEWFARRIEIVFVGRIEQLWSTRRIQFITSAIAVAEKTRGPTFQMI